MGEVRRHPERGSTEGDTIRAILGDGLVAHVGIIDSDGAPVVIPMAYALDGDSILIHGSVASRLMRTEGPICVTVTLLDGIVYARSLFNSSMNYRSVVVTGVPDVLEGDERERALNVLSSFLLPGRLGHAREPNRVEVRQTTVWRLSLDGASAKVRSGPPKDDPASDRELPFWGGVVPVQTVFGEPESDGVGVAMDVPDHVRNRR
ncbi:MAG: pyridoxamine 5'-phosphate oxidase family protein [Actinobacteria bacterium]|nr:pyridoxamine 5'-phosphate oxidase family protein [Actinomycetota bacterium]